MRATFAARALFLSLLVGVIPDRASAEDDEAPGLLEELAAPAKDHGTRWALLRNDSSEEARAELLVVAKSAPAYLAEGAAGRKLAITLGERSAAIEDEASEIFVTALILALGDEGAPAKDRVLSARNRGTILRALAQSRHPLALRTLDAWTNAKDEELRAGARDALGRGPGAEGERILTRDDLTDRSENHRLDLFRRLARGEARLEDSTFDFLLRDAPLLALRLAAFRCPDGEAVGRALETRAESLLGSGDEPSRSVSAFFVARCFPEHHRELIDHEDRVLSSAGASAAPPRVESPSTTDALHLGRAPKNPKEALLLGRSLGRSLTIDDKRRPVIRELFASLHDHEKRAFVRGLSESGSPKAFPLVLEEYERENDAFVRAAFVDALRRLRGTRHPTLRDIALYDPDRACRRLALVPVEKLAAKERLVSVEYSSRRGTLSLTRLDGVPFETTIAPDGLIAIFGTPVSPIDFADSKPSRR